MRNEAVPIKDPVHHRLYFLLSLSLLSPLIASGQKSTEADRFQPPMDLPISLAGNFMELRSDHFHSGLDLRTGNREGVPVKSVADGWVSRVKVSPWGYGKALYIDHPNGYTTVYGHLRNYSGAIADAVLDAHYRAKDFEIDVTFKPGELPVKAGQVVAMSGNTGGSTGPHLHFEVRRTSDQHALDPERFGVEADDTVPPTLLGLRIDPLDSLAKVPAYPNGLVGYPLTGSHGTYTLKEPGTLMAFGTVGLSVNVMDTYNVGGSTCGVRALNVWLDGVALYSAELGEIDFNLQRYANAYMDYGLFKDSDKLYNRCYKLPNNKLAVYGNEPAQGRIRLEPGTDHVVRVEALDAHGHRSVLEFNLRGATAAQASGWATPKMDGQLFRYDRENTLMGEDLSFVLPANSLYQDERIHYRTSTPSHRGLVQGKVLGAVHHLHDPLTPLHQQGQLSLKVPSTVRASLTPKMLVVRFPDKGAPAPLGGTVRDGWITARIKAFGNFAVMIDTTPPTLVPIGISITKPLKAESLRFKVGDDLSGLEKWSGLLDGEWILFEYDPKKRQLSHLFDKHSDKPGKHTIAMKATDERGNVRTMSLTFTR